MTKFKDLTNQRFGKLLAIEYNGMNEKKKHLWLCQCDCGNKKIVTQDSLKAGAKSCGCSRLGNKWAVKHNLNDSRLHIIWHSMYCRCYYPTTNQYKNYGGRGIKICDEWKKDFMSFYNWAIKSGYKDNLTLDRIDVNGNYEPSNCRWKTKKEQSNNRTNNVWYEFRGEKKTAKQWCEIFNIKQTTLNDRLKRGWTLEQALTISTDGTCRKVNF